MNVPLQAKAGCSTNRPGLWSHLVIDDVPAVIHNSVEVPCKGMIPNPRRAKGVAGHTQIYPIVPGLFPKVICCQSCQSSSKRVTWNVGTQGR